MAVMNILPNCERCHLMRGRSEFCVREMRTIVSKPAGVRTKVNGQKRAKKKVTLDATLNNNLGRRFWDSLYMHDIPTCQVCNKYKQIL